MTRSETPSLANEGSRTFDGYLALPHDSPKPAIMILTEMFGVNGPMRELADQYAARGFCAFVPNLFWRCDPPRGLAYEGAERETAWQRLRGFDFGVATDDMKTAVAWMRARPECSGKVGAIGFCMGGRLAFLAAAHANVDAAASFYALGVSNHLGDVGRIRCPLQVHYGAVDEHVPTAEIEKVLAGVRDNPHIVSYLYENAGHSFFNRVRPTYNADAAALAATRIDGLFATLASKR